MRLCGDWTYEDVRQFGAWPDFLLNTPFHFFFISTDIIMLLVKRLRSIKAREQDVLVRAKLVLQLWIYTVMFGQALHWSASQKKIAQMWVVLLNRSFRLSCVWFHEVLLYQHPSSLFYRWWWWHILPFNLFFSMKAQNISYSVHRLLNYLVSNNFRTILSVFFVFSSVFLSSFFLSQPKKFGSSLPYSLEHNELWVLLRLPEEVAIMQCDGSFDLIPDTRLATFRFLSSYYFMRTEW